MKGLKVAIKKFPLLSDRYNLAIVKCLQKHLYHHGVHLSFPRRTILQENNRLSFSLKGGVNGASYFLLNAQKFICVIWTEDESIFVYFKRSLLSFFPTTLRPEQWRDIVDCHFYDQRPTLETDINKNFGVNFSYSIILTLALHRTRLLRCINSWTRIPR